MRQSRLNFAPTSSPLGSAEIMRMADMLIGCHGGFAPEIAQFMVAEETAQHDHARAQAWQAVKHIAADMLSGRLPRAGAQIH